MTMFTSKCDKRLLPNTMAGDKGTTIYQEVSGYDNNFLNEEYSWTNKDIKILTVIGKVSIKNKLYFCLLIRTKRNNIFFLWFYYDTQYRITPNKLSIRLYITESISASVPLNQYHTIPTKLANGYSAHGVIPPYHPVNIPHLRDIPSNRKLTNKRLVSPSCIPHL